MSAAAPSAASGTGAAASKTPGLLRGQLGGNVVYSHTASDRQAVTRVLSHLVAGSSAKIQQSDVEQPRFLATS